MIAASMSAFAGDAVEGKTITLEGGKAGHT